MADGSKVLFSRIVGPSHKLELLESEFDVASKVIDSNARLKKDILEYGSQMQEWVDSDDLIAPPPYFFCEQLLRMMLEGYLNEEKASNFSHKISYLYFKNSKAEEK